MFFHPSLLEKVRNGMLEPAMMARGARRAADEFIEGLPNVTIGGVMKLSALILAVCALTARPVLSQSPPAREARDAVNYETARLSKIATAVRITEPITLDGHLEEPAWA